MTVDANRAGLGPDTAVVVVDVQNDFADPGGNLYVAGGDQVVPVINELVAEARRVGSPVFYTQDWHPPETPHFEAYGGTWPVHCVRDTWGAELHPGLAVEGPVVRKGTGGEDGYSGFYARDVDTGEDQATDLHHHLAAAGVSRVLVVGLAEDVCVKATAIDAHDLGYDATVVLSATRPVNAREGDDARARRAMEDAGVALA
jgi:nicotinamidase/pyrazinamidase